MVTGDAARERLRRGIERHQAGDLAGAAAVYHEVLASAPGHPDALHLLGLVAHREGRLDEARARVQAALAAQPDNPVFAANFGNICKDAGDVAGAVAHYRRALALDPRQSGARNNLGTLLLADRHLDEAIACFRTVVADVPGHARAWHNLGLALQQRGESAAAIDAQRRAVALDPRFDAAIAVLARLLQQAGRAAEAVGVLAPWAARAADSAAAQADLALAQHQAGLVTDAQRSYERALALEPGWLEVRCNLCALLQKACQWDALDRHWPIVAAAIDAARAGVPLGLLVAQPGVTPAMQLAAARANAQAQPAPPPAPRSPFVMARERVRVGYLSADFREHATAYLAAGLFELHDRSAVEVVLLSYGPDDRSAMRQRIAGAADAFVDVAAQDDATAAARIAALDLDVLVDLNGNTDNARMGIAARRPAPVQVNWLGFPGTLGDPAYDYLIADAHVVPPGDERWYAEQVVRLPICYQSNDRRRARPVAPGHRVAHGLPASGPVLCSFNQSFKITRPVFAAWMRILAAVPAAVLWLLEDNAAATTALRTAASADGVDPRRVVFAPRLPLSSHLARYRLADLAIDTYPCSSHTTASDALWMGCPLVTVVGTTFASRVAASLVAAAGMPELAVADLAAFEAAVVRLIESPARLAAAREAAGRADASPLFDTPRFARAMEAAYRTMAQRSRRGLAPAGFDVPDASLAG